MKTLLTIAIFFACLQVSGQNDTNSYWFDLGEPTPITPYYDKDGITIKHLIDYGNKCYADSSQAMIKIPCPPNMPECMGVFKQVWIHKEPTFAGFIEYLRKSQKK